MNTTADTVIRHFFDEAGMDQVPLDLLQQFVEDYPYVAAGHLLLAKKLYDHHEIGAEDYASAANIYLHNPLLLDEILNPVTDNGSGHFELRAKQIQDAIASQQDNQTDSSFDIPDAELTETERSYLGYGTSAKEAAPESVSSEIVPEETIPGESDTETTLEYQAEPTAEFSQESTEFHEPVSEFHEPTAEYEEPAAQHQDKNEEQQHESESVTYAFAPENYGVNTGHHVEQNEFEIAQAEENSAATNQEEAFDPQFHEIPVGDEPPAETAEVADIPSSSFDPNAGANETVADETAEQKGGEFELNQEEVPDLNEVTAVDKSGKETVGEIKLEPYYTVDYFASQGIRLQNADIGKDNIGKQLRSFTDWLRSMKKLPSPTDSPADEAVQQSILRIAAHSLEEKEVITETMAEVWAKQGHVQRAMDIYNKLSLQNPSKSHYFAAKIEQLKSL